MNIKVNVEVKTNSGAVINLTDPQAHQVAKYIENVIFGTPEVKEKRTYTKKRSCRAWTADEIALVQKVADLPMGKEKNKATKKLSLELKRSRGAISQMGTILRRNKKEPVTNIGSDFKSYRPLDILSSDYMGK
jgi:hypothetical protein